VLSVLVHLVHSQPAQSLLSVKEGSHIGWSQMLGVDMRQAAHQINVGTRNYRNSPLSVRPEIGRYRPAEIS
jgi:hypothetical protein